MKFRKKILTFLPLLVPLLLSNPIQAKPRELNIYGWADYLPREVLQKFEKETGIICHYTTFSSNQELFTKLRINPKIGYDIIMPSTDIADQMRREKMLLKLKKARLANLSNIIPGLRNRSYDPDNNYTIPFFWGTVGIMVNSEHFHPKDLENWKDIWQAKYRNRLVLYDDMRDIFAVALRHCGYSINDQDPEHIKEAYQALKQLQPNILAFLSDSIFKVFINNDALIGIDESGDWTKIHQENPSVRFLEPKSRAILWIDTLAIPRFAPHPKEAHLFLNFLMRPKIAALCALQVGFTTGNLSALKLLHKNKENSQILTPSLELLQTGETEDFLPTNIRQLYIALWGKLKTSF